MVRYQRVPVVVIEVGLVVVARAVWSFGRVCGVSAGFVGFDVRIGLWGWLVTVAGLPASVASRSATPWSLAPFKLLHVKPTPPYVRIFRVPSVDLVVEKSVS